MNRPYYLIIAFMLFVTLGVIMTSGATDPIDDIGEEIIEEANEPPSAPENIMVSEQVYVGETIEAIASGSIDPEGSDPTYYYEFYNIDDSQILADFSEANVYTTQESDENNSIRVTAKAFDGNLYSSATSVDIEVLEAPVETTTTTTTSTSTTTSSTTTTTTVTTTTSTSTTTSSTTTTTRRSSGSGVGATSRTTSSTSRSTTSSTSTSSTTIPTATTFTTTSTTIAERAGSGDASSGTAQERGSSEDSERGMLGKDEIDNTKNVETESPSETSDATRDFSEKMLPWTYIICIAAAITFGFVRLRRWHIGRTDDAMGRLEPYLLDPKVWQDDIEELLDETEHDEEDREEEDEIEALLKSGRR